MLLARGGIFFSFCMVGEGGGGGGGGDGKVVSAVTSLPLLRFVVSSLLWHCQTWLINA